MIEAYAIGVTLSLKGNIGAEIGKVANQFEALMSALILHGRWYRAPGWPAAARNQRLIPAAADPSFTGQH